MIAVGTPWLKARHREPLNRARQKSTVAPFQNVTGIEKMIIKTTRNGAGPTKTVYLWELLRPWEEETEDLWQMGQVTTKEI